MKLTVLSIAIRAIPEAFIIIWLGARLLGLKPSIKALIYAAIIQGIIDFAIRAFLPIRFGIHTLIMMFFYIIVVYLLLHIDIGKAISVALTGSIASGIAEIITSPLIQFFGTPMDVLERSTALQLLYGLPSLVLMIIIGWLGGMFADTIKKRRAEKNKAITGESPHEIR